MKKLLIIALIFGVPYSAHALSSSTIIGTNDCCTSKYDTTQYCTRYYCTWFGTTTEYTDCDTCETSGMVVQKNGSYQPCGTNSALFDVEVGKCVQGAITAFCAIGQYSNNGTCIDCPDGGTSEPGATSITQCYIPGGTGGTDATGTWKYTENCYYREYDTELPGIDIPAIPVNP